MSQGALLSVSCKSKKLEGAVLLKQRYLARDVESPCLLLDFGTDDYPVELDSNVPTAWIAPTYEDASKVRDSIAT